MPAAPFYVADPSIKGVPLQALPESAWKYLIGQPEDEAGQLSALSAWNKVDWLYRAVDMRAKAVQKMPYQLLKGDQDVTKLPEYAKLQRKLSDNLYRTEAALCLYGAAYWKKDRNQFGLNVTPRWLLPTSITPELDEDVGLKHFNRSLTTGRSIPLKIEDVVYFWVPSLEAEIGPGAPPAKRALMSAGVIYSVNLTTKAFFDRGMIKAVILTLEGNPPPGEAEKLNAWWKRVGAGVKNAWNSIVVRSTVKPVVIGDGFKDSVNPQLTDQARQGISTAMGVPYSLMQSSSLAGGTAEAEQLNFYDQTIIPECDLIAEAVNEQWLEVDEGVTIKFLPNKLEVFQQKELAKADAISKVVGRPIMTVNEGRERMELPPLSPSDLGDVAQNTIHVKPSGDSLGPDTNADQLPKLVPLKPDAGAPKALDFRRWETRTLKRLKEHRLLTQPFESDHISASEHTRILLGLRGAHNEGDIKAVFAQARRGRVRASDVSALLDTQTMAKARQKMNEAKQ